MLIRNMINMCFSDFFPPPPALPLDIVKDVKETCWLWKKLAFKKKRRKKNTVIASGEMIHVCLMQLQLPRRLSFGVGMTRNVGK